MKGRLDFAKATPDMLKYSPKRFWGLLCKNKQSNVQVSAETFAAFNQQLYYNSDIPVDEFELPENISKAKITAIEVKNVLESHFKANKNTGLSKMPL